MTTAELVKLLSQSPVAAASVVGIFSLLALWLGLGRFRSERWWEKKAAAYAEVIEALHGMNDLSTARLDALLGGYEIADNRMETLYAANTKGIEQVRKAASIGSFVMTKRTELILGDLLKALEKNANESAPAIDSHEGRVELLSSAIIAMKVEAKNDLRT